MGIRMLAMRIVGSNYISGKPNYLHGGVKRVISCLECVRGGVVYMEER